MKNWIQILLGVLFALTFFVGCYGLKEENIQGTLTVNPRSGWNQLDFVDGKTGQPFSLKSGKYILAFEHGIYGIREPMIAISNDRGQLMGRMLIPRETLKEDGSFEIYVAQRGNTNSFNILGGKRKIVLNRTRFAKIEESCTYTVTVPCMTTDANGQMTASVCTESRSGDQDQVLERVEFYNSYRILFDGNDIVNVAVFTADGKPQVETNKIAETDCR